MTSHHTTRLSTLALRTGRRPRATLARRPTSHVTRPLCHSPWMTQIIQQQHCKWRRSTFNPSIASPLSFTILSRINLSFLTATELWHTTSQDIPPAACHPTGFQRHRSAETSKHHRNQAGENQPRRGGDLLQ